MFSLIFFFNSSSSLIENLYWQLYSIKLLLTFLYSRKQLQFLHLRLWIPPFKLSTRFDSDVAINPILFMNFILYDINSVVLLLFLPIFTTSFFIGMGKVLYFSLFSAIQSNWSSNSFADDQMKIILQAVVKNYRDVIGQIEF